MKDPRVSMPFRNLSFPVLALAGALCLPALPVHAQQYTFRTLAGAYDGDGGPALAANLAGPTGVAFDKQGNAYVAEGRGHRIRRIAADGTVTTVAGTGIPGFTAQTGPSQLGRINVPQGVALDAQGNLYFSEQGNHRVRKLWADGHVSLVAGNGSAVSSGDGGRATEAGLAQPYGVALDAAGNVYIAEYAGHRVRKVDAQGRISTVAGNGIAGDAGDGGPATAASLAYPTGIALDALGRLYVVDSSNARIRRVSNGQIDTFLAVADGFPNDVAVSPAGEVYVSDWCRLLMVPPAGGLQVLANDPTCLKLSTPEQVAFSPQGEAYFADSNLGVVYRKAPRDPFPARVAGRGSFFGDGGPAALASLSYTTGVAVDAQGATYVADAYYNNRIRKLRADSTIGTVAGTGDAMGAPGDGGPATQASLYYPYGVALDAAGNLYIADRLHARVRKVGANGTIATIAGDGTFGDSGDGGPATHARLKRPQRVAVDAAGNVYIADAAAHRVRKVSAAGTITTVAGTGAKGFSGDGGPAQLAALDAPSGVALDAAGNLYIADANNFRVRRVNAAGVIATVAGNGGSGHGGDGGPATQAAIGRPTGVAIDGAGRLFIAAGALRMVDAGGTIATQSNLRYPAFDVAVAPDGSLRVAVLGGRVLLGEQAAASPAQ